MRPATLDDTRFAWAAYRKGGLLDIEAGLEAPEFDEVFWSLVGEQFDAVWAAEKRDRVFGLVFGIWPSKSPDGEPLVPLLWIGEMAWFPWASARDRLEAAARFVEDARKEVVVMEFAKMQDKAFFERLCRYGVMRRIGTLYGFYPDGPAALFQSRTR